MPKPEPQRCWCEISLSALTHNVRELQKRAGKGVEVMAVVKADAYGHGMIPVARHLLANGCSRVGCATTAEAQTLRRAGVTAPILLLSSFLEHEIPSIVGHHLCCILSSLEEARLMENAARRAKERTPVEIKIDTGMGRLGVPPGDFPELLDFVQKSRHLELQGILTHFACADESGEFTRRQWKLFTSLIPEGCRHHAANSAGVLAFPETSGSCIRPGLAVYGASPIPRFQKDLRQALSWKTRATLVHSIPKGTTLSYGATFTSKRPMRVATLAVGYGDGLFRSLSSKGFVLIHGKKAPILGRVTMDQIVVDVSRIPGVERGTVATLLGEDRGRMACASQMAEFVGTIPYEIWTSITERVPRLYKG